VAFLQEPQQLDTSLLHQDPEFSQLSPPPHQLPVNTDRWYYLVFQGAPDLIRALLPSSDPGANALSLDPAAPGDGLYRFEALELKELSHRLDGVLWPRESTGGAHTGSPRLSTGPCW
jgi:hypothetical protein